MRKLGIVLLLLLAIPVGCTGYAFVYELQNAQRFRLTIEVETPEGVKSGSSVIETMSWESGWGPIEARGVRSRARGEAVFVDLGEGRNVIAILGWGPYGQETDKIYGLTRTALAPGQRVSWKDAPKLKGGGELPPDYIPTLITFSDLNDPGTARVVRVSDSTAH